MQTHIFQGKQKYSPMWDLQKEWVQEIDQGLRPSSLLFLEHDHVYTLGRGASWDHFLTTPEYCAEKGIEVAEIDRGGDITYHGPGQLVGYPLLILDQINNDTQKYLRKLEETIIKTLQHYGVVGGRKEEYTGVWVADEKIAAIGIKFNRGRRKKAFITSHGFALNINTDLEMFQYIIPCGIREYGVASMKKILGQEVDLEDVINTYIRCFEEEFAKKVL